jgi:hypothetical protein
VSSPFFIYKFLFIFSYEYHCRYVITIQYKYNSFIIVSRTLRSMGCGTHCQMYSIEFNWRMHSAIKIKAHKFLVCGRRYSKTNNYHAFSHSIIGRDSLITSSVFFSNPTAHSIEEGERGPRYKNNYSLR